MTDLTLIAKHVLIENISLHFYLSIKPVLVLEIKERLNLLPSNLSRVCISIMWPIMWPEKLHLKNAYPLIKIEVVCMMSIISFIWKHILYIIAFPYISYDIVVSGFCLKIKICWSKILQNWGEKSNQHWENGIYINMYNADKNNTI